MKDCVVFVSDLSSVLDRCDPLKHLQQSVSKQRESDKAGLSLGPLLLLPTSQPVFSVLKLQRLLWYQTQTWCRDCAERR